MLKASGLVMTERIPLGFLDEEAMAGLLVGVDVLDAVLLETSYPEAVATATVAGYMVVVVEVVMHQRWW